MVILRSEHSREVLLLKHCITKLTHVYNFATALTNIISLTLHVCRQAMAMFSWSSELELDEVNLKMNRVSL